MRVAALAGALLSIGTVLSSAEGQPLTKVPRIGVLTLSVASSTPILDAFRHGLREHGYLVGQNIALEIRFAEGRPERLPPLAAELVKMNVDVIVTESVLAAREARLATETIPIVTAIHGDPVGAGLVASITRPGGNVTGLSLVAPDLSGKRLQLLKEIIPRATQVAAIWNRANPAAAGYLAETEVAAVSLGLQLQSVEVRSPADLDLAFTVVTRARPGALITLPDGMLLANKTRIVEFAAKSRLPAVFPDREFAEAGGLMTYGPSLASNFRRAAGFVDKILRGAKPGDLPIEQPIHFEMVVNLATATSLGLTIPHSIVQRADHVIR